MSEMKESGVIPNSVTYSVAITACAHARQHEKAIELLDEMRELGLIIDAVPYNSAISACEKVPHHADLSPTKRTTGCLAP